MIKVFSPLLMLFALGFCAACDSKPAVPKVKHSAKTTSAEARVSRVKLSTQVSTDQSRSETPKQSGHDAEQQPANEIEICSDCHPDAVEGFLATGMGRSLRRIETVEVIEKFEPGKTTIKHEESGLIYRVYRDDDGRWWQEESLPAREFKKKVEVKYVVGSGNHGRTYLGELGGEIVELPLTWYSQKGLWDLSPSYKTGNMRFDRHIRPRCLFCHNDFTPWREGTLGGYTERLADGISCSRCHGDSREHVRLRTAGKGPPPGQPDPSILNPSRLSPRRQRQVCQQCHLVGEARMLVGEHRWDAYDVRTPLEDYMAIFVADGPQGPDFGIASHGYRLSQSACAQDEKLTCSTCHNVHKPNTRADYRNACLSCHTVDDCGTPGSTAHTGDCAKCHMLRGGTDDTPHVSFTDHYIRKDPASVAPRSQAENQWRIVNGLELPGTANIDSQLHRGLAHFGLFMSGGNADERAVHGERGINALKEVLRTQPSHERAHSALGRIYEETGRSGLAHPHYAEAIKANPTDPLLRMYGGKVARKLGYVEESIMHYQVATRLRPDFLEAWVELGRVLAQANKVDEARKALMKAEEIAPDHAPTAINFGLLEQKNHRSTKARTWFLEAIKRDPVNMMGHLNLCMLEFALRDIPGALRCADESLKLHPEFTDGYWIRGRAHFMLGQHAAARKDLQRVLELDPLRENGYLDLAQVEQATGHRLKAREILMQARKRLGPSDGITKALNSLQSR